MKKLDDMSKNEIREYERNLDHQYMELQERMKLEFDALLNDSAITLGDGTIRSGKNVAIVLAKSALEAHDILSEFERIEQYE